jgi:signal-transduction protein with cAMP-binding, CBS, and nucleotidyltransferase domain
LLSRYKRTLQKWGLPRAACPEHFRFEQWIKRRSSFGNCVADTLIAEYKLPEPITAGPDEIAYDAAARLENLNARCIVVTSKEKKILGFVARYDLIHELIVRGKDPKKTKLKEVMNASPIWIDSSSTSMDALRKMIEKRVERLVVVETGSKKVLGMISLEDVVSHLDLESLTSLSREKYEKIREMVRKMTPVLLERYDGEEREDLTRDLKDESKALLRLLDEAEVRLRS